MRRCWLSLTPAKASASPSAIILQWFDTGRAASDDQLSRLQHDGRLVILDAGTKMLDHGTMVWPPHPAVTMLIVRSGQYRDAKCWVEGPAPKVR